MGSRKRRTSVAGPLVPAAGDWGAPAAAQCTAENTVREAEDGRLGRRPIGWTERLVENTPAEHGV